jgi:hypothetical protein
MEHGELLEELILYLLLEMELEVVYKLVILNLEKIMQLN